MKRDPFNQTLTKQALTLDVASATGLTHSQVASVIQGTLNRITAALAWGKRVELREFGVFTIGLRKARMGRIPSKPNVAVPIPACAVVKFKAGKGMREQVRKIFP